LLEQRAHGPGNGAALERTAGRLADDENIHTKGGAGSSDDPEVLGIGDPFHSGEQHGARGVREERLQVGLGRDPAHGQRALVQGVTGEGFQDTMIGDVNDDLVLNARSQLGLKLLKPSGSE